MTLKIKTRVPSFQEKLSENWKFLMSCFVDFGCRRSLVVFLHARFRCSDFLICNVLSGKSLRFFRKLLYDQENICVAFEFWRYNRFVDGFQAPGGRFPCWLSRERSGTRVAVTNCHQCRKNLLVTVWGAKFSDDVSLFVSLAIRIDAMKSLRKLSR